MTSVLHKRLRTSYKGRTTSRESPEDSEIDSELHLSQNSDWMMENELRPQLRTCNSPVRNSKHISLGREDCIPHDTESKTGNGRGSPYTVVVQQQNRDRVLHCAWYICRYTRETFCTT